ncbi:hypothetical protein Y886_06605 [Xanthomonas hyacinthi DSM 19077]|nr:hypothetical protein Y886_06605 [Xanthomonas hyacinthi DSM 19077]
MDEAREELARGVATLAADPAFDSALREHIAKGKASLGEVLSDVHTPSSAGTVSLLRDLERKAIELRGLTGALDALIDVRVHGVGRDAPLPATDDVWVGTVSRDPVSGARQVVAFDAAGAEHHYDLEAVPAVPMLIIESDSGAAIRAGTTVMNEILRQGGVQAAHRLAGSSHPGVSGVESDAKVEELTLLKRIYLEKDHEPDIQGDAEIFAIVSGVGKDGKPQLITKDMPWLDHDKRWYTPGMDLINWTDYGTNYVNVQLFEEDGNTNFKALAESVLVAVGDLSLLISPEAPPALIVTGVTKIANEILKAMPAVWFENSNDYVESFYVIERGGNYGTEAKPLVGARGEARMVLAPHEVKNR